MKKRETKKNKANGKGLASGNGALTFYFREIKKFPPLSIEEEQVISRQAVQGDKAAREKLVKSNLAFVIMIAKKYQGRGLDLDDLISEGNIGLIRALDSFEPDKGYRFISYAVWWIRQTIQRAIISKSRLIRIPHNKIKELSRTSNEPEAQDKPDWNEFVRNEEDAVSPEKLSNLMCIGQPVISLNDTAFRGDDTASELIDFIVDESSVSPVEHAMNSMLKDEINELLGVLEKRSAEVIRHRYGLGESAFMSLQEIGDHLNLSKERVRQIERRALVEIQDSSSGNLKAYTI